MLYGKHDGRGVWGKTNTSACMAESMCNSPGTIQHCQSAIPQNKTESLNKQRNEQALNKQRNEQALLCTLRNCSYF